MLGETLALSGRVPSRARRIGATDGSRLLRWFRGELYAVNRTTGRIWRTPVHGGPQRVYALGPASEPMDVHVLPSAGAARQALVTRRNDPFLHRLDLVNATGADVLDLTPVGGGAPIALGTMERDGDRLFVQVRVFDTGTAAPGLDTGVLAVVDLSTLALVDVDPASPGVQGIALQGAPPRLRMQVLGRTLFVSTTEGTLDSRGGIEMVDLDLLASVGFALHERQSADLGGFVMTKPDEGFFVFHTDLLPSTHLQRFTIQGGPDPGEIIGLITDAHDSLAFDELNGHVLLPSGHALGPAGIYVFDAETKQPVGNGLITTSRDVVDVVVAPR